MPTAYMLYNTANAKDDRDLPTHRDCPIPRVGKDIVNFLSGESNSKFSLGTRGLTGLLSCW